MLMPIDLETTITRELVAQISLFGMGLDLLGGIYLTYDLLGGKNGPLRTITRAVGYISLFFIGYLVVLGFRYAIVAATGMGILLAVEYRIASQRDPDTIGRSGVMLFGFLRGMVLGLAAITIAGPRFGLWFGVLSGAALVATYKIGFAPTDDYARDERPRLSRHKLMASLVRAFAVGVAGFLAGLVFRSSAATSTLLGLRLGAAAGCVSALVGVFSPMIESRIDDLPERRMGVVGLLLIVFGMALQSFQYWLTVFGISPG